MASYSVILTHPGSAHKDEFLACCVLLAEAAVPVSIVRREPTAADLADASVAVVDVGHAHDPALRNFDHHQLPAEMVPTCSLSLVLHYLGLYEDARAFCDWLEPAEWFDCRGPNATARWLGVEREIVNRLYSPIDGTLLRRFASAQEVTPTEPLGQLMRWVGEDLLDYIRSLRARLSFVAKHAETWTLSGVVTADGAGPAVLFMPRTEPLPEEPSAGLDRYVETALTGERIVAVVAPDRRGAGYGLSRHRDDPTLDFTRIAGEPDVHFAHARGFVAKTSATDPVRLRELLVMAAGGAAG